MNNSSKDEFLKASSKCLLHYTELSIPIPLQNSLLSLKFPLSEQQDSVCLFITWTRHVRELINQELGENKTVNSAT